MMRSLPIALVATLFATTAMAQTAMAQNANTPGAAPTATPGNAPGATSNAPMAGVNPSTGTTPGTSMSDRNSGTAAASGDRNQAVATTSADAPQPARGSNSFSRGQARSRIERHGFQKVSGLHKDDGGVWRGMGMKDGQQVKVWLDYKGNAGEQQ